ncbi:ceramide glucosyltransferase [Patella vulgata]|uniref:ceramide glucosyltransferase n=1 Tax=Patella vulgata TaxID=6465 RepID=UPI00217FA7B3|nr:ceramide glucosyltransferase [Patella vulgata]XP_050403095.1 ceramide glucosyltransferase [Patella vulgata]XP_050403096.1 ceramide glucosyltransferase [Patella vulgata]XP_050403097.1 ceramide glucosyltransferase [Patella vulgata]
MYTIDPQTWSYIVLVFGIMGLVLYIITTCLLVLALVYAKFVYYRKSEPLLETDEAPGVSIIKPLMGLDPLLEDNLDSHFKLKYSKFELLFCVHDDDDPAINLVEKLKERYPKVETRMFIGGQAGIINPMVNNMAPAYNAAAYNYVWISTSRIKVSTEVILDLVSKLQKPDVGLVHQIPFVTDESGFGAAIEKIYFGSAMARYYISLNALGLCCMTGMSYMFKKTVLDECNGLVWYGRYLAEDFFLASSIHRAGYKLVLSSYPAQQNVACPTVKGFISRMVRWMRLRINALTIVTVIMEPSVDCFPLGLWGAWCFHEFFSINPYFFMTIHVTFWIIRDYLQLLQLQNTKLTFSLLYFIIAWTVRELLQTMIVFLSLFKPHEIKWGKRIYYVQCGGQTQIISDKSAMHL